MNYKTIILQHNQFIVQQKFNGFRLNFNKLLDFVNYINEIEYSNVTYLLDDFSNQFFAVVNITLSCLHSYFLLSCSFVVSTYTDTHFGDKMQRIVVASRHKLEKWL